ncbi:hypothetical protein HNY73_010365 [Argiope bruennichi]|uniref:Uncharacterized protein n=1 Tax=Argiope bruennichi TaxID=94029 RepID=A0A8T0F1L1_ARGBR|nr:hypothetical protein HNY73_010365 [Argiope bruennichi]
MPPTDREYHALISTCLQSIEVILSLLNGRFLSAEDFLLSLTHLLDAEESIRWTATLWIRRTFCEQKKEYGRLSSEKILDTILEKTAKKKILQDILDNLFSYPYKREKNINNDIKH